MYILFIYIYICIYIYIYTYMYMYIYEKGIGRLEVLQLLEVLGIRYFRT